MVDQGIKGLAHTHELPVRHLYQGQDPGQLSSVQEGKERQEQDQDQETPQQSYQADADKLQAIWQEAPGSKLAWDAAKRFRNQRAAAQMRPDQDILEVHMPDGTAISAATEVRDVFKTHHAKLATAKEADAMDGFDMDHYKRVMHRVHEWRSTTHTGHPTLHVDITTREVSAALQAMLNNKAGDYDNIIAEFLKYGGEALVIAATDLFNDALNAGREPITWMLGTIVSLHKQGDKRTPTTIAATRSSPSSAKRTAQSCATGWPKQYRGKITGGLPSRQGVP